MLAQLVAIVRTLNRQPRLSAFTIELLAVRVNLKLGCANVADMLRAWLTPR